MISPQPFSFTILKIMIRTIGVILALLATCVVAQDSNQVEVSTQEREIRDFFDAYHSATKAESSDELCELYDFVEMAKQIIEQGEMAPSVLNPIQFASTLRTMIKKQFDVLDQTWSRHHIMRIDFSDDKQTADVFVRSWSDATGTAREMFRLRKVDEDWRIFDFSELSFGISTVALTSMVMRESFDNDRADEMVFGTRELMQAAVAAAGGDIYEAQQHIDSIVGYAMPRSLQSFRWQLAAAVYAGHDPYHTLELLDNADAFGAPSPIADYIRGTAYLEIERYEIAIKYFYAYLNRFGDDADAYQLLGHALEKLGRRDEAIRAYVAALMDTPDSVENLNGLALALPQDRKAEWVRFYRELPNPIESFETLADSFVDERDVAALEGLVQVASELDPNVAHLAYYQAMIRELRGEHQAAFDDLATLLQPIDADSESRHWYENSLFDISAKCGSELRSYDLSTNKIYAVQALRQSSFEDDETIANGPEPKVIETLYGKMLVDHPNKFEAWMEVGDWKFEQQQYDTAKGFFRNAMDAANDDDQRFESLAQCVTCYLELNQALIAYDLFEPKEDVLDAIEYEGVNDEVMKEIHARFRKSHPDSPRFLWEDLDAMLENGEHEKGLQRVTKAFEDIAAKKSSDLEGELEDEQQGESGLLDVFKSRFLIGMKRYDEAIIAARQAPEGDRDFLRALVYAAKEDRSRFNAAKARYLETDDSHQPSDFDDAREVPKSWKNDASDSVSSVAFSSYQEVRRIVVLLQEPRSVDVDRVLKAMRETLPRLVAIDRQRAEENQDDYLFQADANSVFVASQGCRFLIHGEDSPYLADGNLLVEQFSLESDIADAAKQHKAWIAIEIFQWPQDSKKESARSIPPFATDRMASMIRELTGGVATVAIHADRQIFVKSDDAFFEALTGPNPIKAFGVQW